MNMKISCDFPTGNLKFATKNISDKCGNWENKILNISSLNRNIGEDKSYEVSGITIEFNDTDRFFRNMMSGTKRFIVGKKVEILTENDQLIYTGTVEKWQFSEDAFVLTINDKLSGLEKMIPEVINLDEYPNLPESASGNCIPIIYGSHQHDTGAIKCWRIDTIEDSGNTKGIYLLAGHPCHSLVETNVYDEEGNISATDAELFNTSTDREYIKCSAEEEFVFVNVNGKMDQNSDLIDTPILALIDIISSTSMTYDLDAMNNADAIMQDRKYKITAVINDKESLKDVLINFCFSFDCDFYIGRENEIIITILNWASLRSKKSFNRHHIISFSIEELPDEIRNKVQYNYFYNPGTENFIETPFYAKETSIVNWGEFFFSNEPLDLIYVSDKTTAFDVVQRYVIQRKNPKRIANIELPLSEFVGLDLSDVIEITHPNAIDSNKRKYQIRRINFDFIGDIVQVEAIDITTLTGGVFVLGNRAWTISADSETEPLLKPIWSSTDEFSRNYGYLADRNTGYFSNGIDYGKSLY